MIGHNSFSTDQLREIVKRIERLEDEKQILSGDIREVYKEAKSDGFDARALRSIIRMRRQDDETRLEQESILDTYLAALGMLPIERAIEDAKAAEGAVEGAAVHADVSDPPFIPPDDLDIPPWLKRDKGEGAA